MKLPRVILLLIAVVGFSFFSQISVRALWVQHNGHLMWTPGQVLGTADDNSYTYIIRPIPTEIPTVAPGTASTSSLAAAPDFVVLDTAQSSSSSSSLSSTQTSCFPAGTKILMADKTEKSIENVKTGEYVISDDNGILKTAKVVKIAAPLRDHLYRLRFSDGSTLRLTREHPVYTKEGWKSISPDATRAENQRLNVLPLSVSDSVYTATGTYLPIKDIVYIPGNVQTYNLEEIEGSHTFFADGVLVHNKVTTSSYHGGGGGSGSSSSSSSSSSFSSSSSSVSSAVYCGRYICTAYEQCYQNNCWQKCDVNGNCLGQYYCYNGACLPTSRSASSYSQAPTATPYPVQDTAGGPPKTPSGGDNSPPPTAIPTLIAPNRPTNTPYPTRVPKNATYFASGAGGAPVIIPPTPTPIPDSLQGKNSTIVIETGNTTTILKGEDVNAITIAAPVSAAEHKSSSSAPARNNRETTNDAKPTPLDLALVQKTGSKYALKQEELVVQKGKQKVTISAGDSNSGALVLSQNDIRANVNMGLSINPNTNILTVDTPQGPMRVAIMPEDAVAIARQLKITDPNQIPSDVTLLNKDNQLEYKISATKMEKLLWLIPITIPQDVYLLADTGGLVEIKRTSLYNFITLFTF